ncbi:MAG: phosphatidylglycerophosphatase A [Deltaproteobacteria bacterium]|nr:phosphatidylglycerophosphatase A [Deltaproteobacteria bacterium]
MNKDKTEPSVHAPAEDNSHATRLVVWPPVIKKPSRPPKAKGPHRIIVFLASGAYSGLSPFAPGTVGTAAAIPLYLILANLSNIKYLIATLAVIIIGIWVAGQGEKISETKDPSWIVIDEIAGFLVTMAFVPFSFSKPWTIVAGFLLFRFFDIVKPYPVRLIERRMPGGWGVVLDDVAAGIYANFFLHLLWWSPFMPN